MKLITLIENIITENAHLDNVLKNYVGDGKIISNELFQDIKNQTPEIQYQVWLILRVVEYLKDKKEHGTSNKPIHDTDITKFKKYFEVFSKYKRFFPIKDIGRIKSNEDVLNFLKLCKELKEKEELAKVSDSGGVKKEENTKNYVSIGDIQKLDNVGIKFLGISEGYQVFEVPNELKNSDKAWQVYKNILAKCAGREGGEANEICTMGNYNHFKNYLEDYPGSSYFVMYNQEDPNSPYQFHFESKQYMDRKDNPVI